MYDELVKRLRTCPDYNDGCTKCPHEHDLGCRSTTMREAADAIEELQGKADAYLDAMTYEHNRAARLLWDKEHCWIPVTERLPKKEWKIYWICTDSGYQCECRWTNNMYGLGKSDNWGWHIMDKPQYQKVIAWRELPEPYEPPKEKI